MSFSEWNASQPLFFLGVGGLEVCLCLVVGVAELQDERYLHAAAVVIVVEQLLDAIRIVCVFGDAVLEQVLGLDAYHQGLLAVGVGKTGVQQQGVVAFSVVIISRQVVLHVQGGGEVLAQEDGAIP